MLSLVLVWGMPLNEDVLPLAAWRCAAERFANTYFAAIRTWQSQRYREMPRVSLKLCRIGRPRRDLRLARGYVAHHLQPSSAAHSSLWTCPNQPIVIQPTPDGLQQEL